MQCLARSGGCTTHALEVQRPVEARTEAIPGEHSQVQCEMLAAKALVLHLSQVQAGQREECEICGHLPLVIVAVDADAVRFCLRKGYSGDQRFRAAIRAMLICEVWCYRIPGDSNVADAPSRRRLNSVQELDPDANRSSIAALLEGWTETRRHHRAE